MTEIACPSSRSTGAVSARESGGGVDPGHGVIDQHRAVVPTLGDLTRLRLGGEGIRGVDQHHGYAVTFGPIKSLNCDSVCHWGFLHDYQRFGMQIRSLSAVGHMTHLDNNFWSFAAAD